MQSEKARGKQRAVFLPDQEDEGSEQARIQKSSKSSDDDQEEQEEMNQPAGRMVTIRFTGQEVHGEGDDAGGGTGTDTDLDVWVEEGESVGRVIDKVSLDSQKARLRRNLSCQVSPKSKLTLVLARS